MTVLRGYSILAAVAALGASILLAGVTPSEAKPNKPERSRFRCQAETETVQLNTRYESLTKRGQTRASFRAQFEGSGDDLVAGAQLTVLIDSVSVGTITLVEEVPDVAEGQLRFDSKARGKKVLPFPGNFPVLEAGSLVELQLDGATVVGCELH